MNLLDRWRRKGEMDALQREAERKQQAGKDGGVPAGVAWWGPVNDRLIANGEAPIRRLGLELKPDDRGVSYHDFFPEKAKPSEVKAQKNEEWDRMYARILQDRERSKMEKAAKVQKGPSLKL
jgi:hypothetical protein